MKRTRLLFLFFAMFVFGQMAWAQFNSGSGTSESMAANSEKGWVASVDNGSTVTSYATFSDALSNWGNNCTLKLLADVEISSTINVSNTRTLDLNGFGIKMLSSIYGGAESPGSVFFLNTTGAYLTILDSNPTTTHYYTITDAATNGAGLAKVVDQATYNSALGTKGTFLGGYITGGRNTADNAYGAGVHLKGNNCRLDIYGGTIIGNELIGNTTGGGGVQIEGNDNNAKFYMYGGNIIGNRAAYGGAVYIRSGHAEFQGGLMKYNIAHQTCGGAVHAFGNYSTFVMSGGTLSNNKAACGGALEASGSGTITLTGGSIVNNLATERGGALTNRRVNDDSHNAHFNLSGNVDISGNTRNSNAEQIFLCNTVKLNITGALSNTTSIGVAMTTPGVFTTGYNSYNSTTHPSAFFHSEMAGYIVGRNTSGEAYLHTPYTVTYNGNGNDGGTVPTDAATYAGGVSVSIPSGVPTKTNYAFTGWLNSVDGNTYAANANFTITANTTLTAQWAPAVASVTVGVNTTNYATLSEALSNWVANSTLKLLANVTTSSTITVNNTCTLDLNGYGIRMTGSGAVIAVNWGGNLTLNDSNPTTVHHFDVNANNVASLNEASGTLTIYGGFITGGNNWYGGGIDVGSYGQNNQNGPSLTMNGGTIIGNSGGEGQVGGVCVSRDTKDYYNTFTMNGGAICYNDHIGVGVYPQGTFHMNGGIVHHNNGIGVKMWNSRLLTLNNAVITDNNGWGIQVDTRRAAIQVQGRTIVSGNNQYDICFDRSGDGARALSIVGALHSEARMGISNMSSNTPNPFTSGLNGRGNASNFFSNDANKGVGLTASNEAHLASFPTYTAPTGKSGLYYTGVAQALVNEGAVSGGTMYYSLDNTNWNTTIPTGTDVGDYTVYYRIVGDASHADVIPSPNTVEVTIVPAFSINIDAPTTATNGWYLISSPIGTVSPSSVINMTSNDYDIFRFNQNPPATTTPQGNVYLEWENWNEPNAGSINHNHFNLEPGRGYLYANSQNVELTFVGTPYSGSGQVTLVRSNSNGNTDGRMLGWNLIGNPFGVKATIGDKPFYRINSGHTGIIVRNEEEKDIAPMEGIFVHADNDGEIVIFSTGAKRETASVEDRIVINLSDNKGTIIDRAIVSFDEGHTLPKFQIRENSTKLYIPKDGKDYAIAFSYRIGELPMNFKAEETGVYTLSFSGENMIGVSLVDMIDNVVIDLSVNDTYTFIGTSADREDRFKLVFNSLNDSNIEIFAYQTGSDIVVSGEGELQVFDVMGRLILIRRITGVETVAKPSQSGVYILRLNEKSQKIVVR